MNRSIKIVIVSFILTLSSGIAFSQTPPTAEAYYNLGRQQIGSKDFSGAIKSLSECMKLNPNALACIYARGAAYFENKQYEPSAADFSKVLGNSGLSPRDKMQALYGRIQALCHSGKVEEATSDEAAVKSLGGNIGKTCRQFLIENPGLKPQLETNKKPEPLISQSDTKSADEYIEEGILLRKNCEYKKSVDAIRKAITIDPNVGDYYFELAKSKIYVHQQVALQDLIMAMEFWKIEPKPSFNASTEQERRRQLNDYNTNIAARDESADKLVALLSELSDSGKNFLESECKSKDTNAQTPTTAEGWYNFGNENFKTKKFKEAIDAYTKCIELLPRANGCYDNRAVANFNLKNYKNAIADATKSIEIGPDQVYPYQKRRASYCGSGMVELAEIDEKKIISLGSQPEFKECVDLRTTFKEKAGDLEMTQNNFAAALKEYDAAIAIHPNSVTYKKRAETHCKMGSETLAKADEAKVIELGGKVTNPCK